MILILVEKLTTDNNWRPDIEGLWSAESNNSFHADFGQKLLEFRLVFLLRNIIFNTVLINLWISLLLILKKSSSNTIDNVYVCHDSCKSGKREEVLFPLPCSRVFQTHLFLPPVPLNFLLSPPSSYFLYWLPQLRCLCQTEGKTKFLGWAVNPKMF